MSLRRSQLILLILLFLVCSAMGVALWQMRQHAHAQLLEGEDSAPTQAPSVAPNEQALLLVANDTDGSMQTQAESLPLPTEAGARGRAVVGKLLDLYAQPSAAHPVPGGAAGLLGLFLVPAPPEPSAPGLPPAELKPEDRPLVAIINLSSTFANNHPAGIAPETLTILSVVATLHANLPRVNAVRFLVDGQARPSLNGHADLTRTYLATDAPAASGVRP